MRPFQQVDVFSAEPLRGNPVAVVHGAAVSAEHLVMATIYSLAWTTLLLVVAGSIFSRKELRGE